MGESAKIVLIIQTEDIAICKGLRNRFFSSKKMTFISKKRQKENKSLGVLETYFRQWLQESSCACSMQCYFCQTTEHSSSLRARTWSILPAAPPPHRAPRQDPSDTPPSNTSSTDEYNGDKPMQRHFPSKGFLGIFPKVEGPNNKGREEKEKDSRSALRKKKSPVTTGQNHGRNI